jgi:hypothetical protein
MYDMEYRGRVLMWGMYLYQLMENGIIDTVVVDTTGSPQMVIIVHFICYLMPPYNELSN